MKIIFLVSSMAGGGAERIASLLCNGWAEQGHDVLLLPTFSQRGGVAYRMSDRVEVRFLSDQVGTNASKISRLSALRQQIRNERPDVIISFLPHVNAAAIMAAAGSGIPVIVSERIHPPLMALPLSYRLQRRLTYPFANTIVAQTEVTARWLRARVPGATIAVIPNPVEHPLVATEPTIAPANLIGADRRLLLWAGRFDPQKRPELIVDAFAAMATQMPEWDLAMIGDGALRAEMVQRVAAAGLYDRIHMPGFAGNLGDWYARSDLYVMTSAFEGFPNTLLEAMAYGLPAIAFDVPTGPAELSAGGTRLFLLPDRDQGAQLRDALVTITRDSAQRLVIGAAARAVASEYALPAIMARWDAVVAQAIARKHQSAGKSNSS